MGVLWGCGYGSRGVSTHGPYAPSKAAIIRRSESMSAELRQHRSHVNCVLPTILDTPQESCRHAGGRSDPVGGA